MKHISKQISISNNIIMSIQSIRQRPNNFRHLKAQTMVKYNMEIFLNKNLLSIKALTKSAIVITLCTVHSWRAYANVLQVKWYTFSTKKTIVPLRSLASNIFRNSRIKDLQSAITFNNR